MVRLVAALLDCQFLDLFPFSENVFVAPEVDISGCDVSLALLVTLVVLILDEGLDLTFEIAGRAVILQQNPVLNALVQMLEFALGSRMDRGTPNVVHLLIAQPLGQIARDVTGPVVILQTWLLPDDGLVATQCARANSIVSVRPSARMRSATHFFKANA